MTVGAVVLSDSLAEALGDAGGRVAIRRIVDAAWAGGALPIIVVVSDPDGICGAVLHGSPAAIVDPADARGLPAWRTGLEAAVSAVEETSALLLWPGRMTWVDPESVTSLIEAHGRDGAAVLRPRRAGQQGWPALLPADTAARVLAGSDPDPAAVLDGLAVTAVELGDPGTVLGAEVRLEGLPPDSGPPEPLGGPPPGWGAAAAETADAEVADPAVTPSG
jgi:CTP:molybdopterin cytidylyltransferase MocA